MVRWMLVGVESGSGLMERSKKPGNARVKSSARNRLRGHEHPADTVGQCILANLCA